MNDQIIQNTIGPVDGPGVEKAVLSMLPERWWARLKGPDANNNGYLIIVGSPDGHEFRERFYDVDQAPENVAAVLKAKIASLK